MLIILTGYMGSGKSIVGKTLSAILEYQCIDLDQYIEREEKMSIAEIFLRKGEVYFRKKERFYLEKILRTAKNTVFALGGGTPCYGDNMEIILKATPYVFYLKVSVPILISRLEKEKHKRPLIRDIAKSILPDAIRKHLFERSFFYIKAPHVIDADRLKPDKIASEICKKITLN